MKLSLQQEKELKYLKVFLKNLAHTMDKYDGQQLPPGEGAKIAWIAREFEGQL